MEKSIQNLQSQLAEFFNHAGFKLTEMDSGASLRRYYYVQFDPRFYFPRKKIILMQVPLDRLETLEDYLNISYYLRRHRIPVPRVYEMSRDQGWIFMEPARGVQLNLHLQHATREELKIIYHELIDFLVEFQIRASHEPHCPVFNRFFDTRKYLYEFNFHVREQLIQNYYGYRFTPKEETAFRNFSREISHHLNLHLPVFVHRDFQSSNIFYHRRGKNNPFQLIDFQDARSGNPVYDLISLLWDSYVAVPEQLQDQLLHKFYVNHPNLRQWFDTESYKKIIDYSIIQRKLHDAGAFIYTWHTTRNRNYIRYIQPAVDWALEYMVPHPALHPARQLFENIIRSKKSHESAHGMY